MKCFDPRDPEQNLECPDTWKHTNNMALQVGMRIIRQSQKGNLPLPQGFLSRLKENADLDDRLNKLS